MVNEVNKEEIMVNKEENMVNEEEIMKIESKDLARSTAFAF